MIRLNRIAQDSLGVKSQQICRHMTLWQEELSRHFSSEIMSSLPKVICEGSFISFNTSLQGQSEEIALATLKRTNPNLYGIYAERLQLFVDFLRAETPLANEVLESERYDLALILEKSPQCFILGNSIPVFLPYMLKEPETAVFADYAKALAASAAPAKNHHYLCLLAFLLLLLLLGLLWWFYLRPWPQEGTLLDRWNAFRGYPEAVAQHQRIQSDIDKLVAYLDKDALQKEHDKELALAKQALDEANAQKLKAEEEARLAQEAALKAQEEQKKALEEQKKAEEERLKALEEQKKAEEAARLKALEEQKKAEEAARLKALEEQKKAEEAARLKALEEQKKAEEARLLEEQKKAEAARKAQLEQEKSDQERKALEVKNQATSTQNSTKGLPKCEILRKEGKMPQLVIAFDGSESMLERDVGGGESRLSAAIRASEALVQNTDKNVSIGLVEINGCPVAKQHGFYAGTRRSALRQQIRNINPYRYDGKTPLINGLQALMNMVDGVNAEAVGVLISDGEDTCPFTANMSVCSLAKRIHALKPKLKIHTILIGSNASQAACIAKYTGGKVFSPKNASQIVSQLKAAGASVQKVCKE